MHTSARHLGDTHGAALATLYDQLHVLQSTSVAALNRAVVTAGRAGPEVSLAAVNALPLSGYPAFDATRADLPRRLDRSEEALAVFYLICGEVPCRNLYRPAAPVPAIWRRMRRLQISRLRHRHVEPVSAVRRRSLGELDVSFRRSPTWGARNLR